MATLPLLHNTAYYTINAFPEEGERVMDTAAKRESYSASCRLLAKEKRSGG
jgi:hypothetical protein